MAEQPVLAKDLDDGSILVATSKGNLFIYDPVTNKSSWTLPDLQRDELVAFLARSRGWVPKDEITSQSVQDLDVEEVIADAKAVDSPDLVFDDNFEDDGDDEQLFIELLSSSHLNAHLPWEAQRDALIDDDRYDAVGSNEARKLLYQKWAAEQKTEPEEGSTAGYIALIRANYKPSLFYVEFKRKFRNDPRFQNAPLSDKQKEKLYRDSALILKKPKPDQAKLLEDANKKDKEHLSTQEELILSLLGT